jgi:hypothetical protein
MRVHTEDNRKKTIARRPSQSCACGSKALGIYIYLYDHDGAEERGPTREEKVAEKMLNVWPSVCSVAEKSLKESRNVLYTSRCTFLQSPSPPLAIGSFLELLPPGPYRRMTHCSAIGDLS